MFRRSVPGRGELGLEDVLPLSRAPYKSICLEYRLLDADVGTPRDVCIRGESLGAVI
jgi:hypothetical protein